MPYASAADLPIAVKHRYPQPHKQEIFKSAFNSALKEYGNESTAFAVAHHAAQHLPHEGHVPIPNPILRAKRPGGAV